MNPNGSKVSDVVLLWFDFFVRLLCSTRLFKSFIRIAFQTRVLADVAAPLYLADRIRDHRFSTPNWIVFEKHTFRNNLDRSFSCSRHSFFPVSQLFRTNQSNCRSSKKKLQIAEIERQTKALETKQKELGITNAREQRQHEKNNGSIGDWEDPRRN